MKRTSTIQIVLDVTHDEALAPADVARIAAGVTQDALLWTNNSKLSRALDGVEEPIKVVLSIVLSTRSSAAK